MSPTGNPAGLNPDQKKAISMNANATELREVTGDELRIVDGGFDVKEIVEAIATAVRDLTTPYCNKACADSKGQVQGELARFR
jgi:hypothetical protein